MEKASKISPSSVSAQMAKGLLYIQENFSLNRNRFSTRTFPMLAVTLP